MNRGKTIVQGAIIGILAAIALIAVVVSAIGLGVRMTNERTEIDSDSYVALRTAATLCPPIRPVILQNMHDGHMMQAGFNHVLDERDRMADEFKVADARNDAVKAAGGKEIPVPHWCMSWDRHATIGEVAARQRFADLMNQTVADKDSTGN